MSECDREDPVIRGSWPTGGCCAINKKEISFFPCSIYLRFLCSFSFKFYTLSFYVTLYYAVRITYVCKGKGKSVPLQVWSGPDGSRKLRFPDLMTTAQDGGKVVSLTHRPPLPPENTPGTHFC